MRSLVCGSVQRITIEFLVAKPATAKRKASLHTHPCTWHLCSGSEPALNAMNERLLTGDEFGKV